MDKLIAIQIKNEVVLNEHRNRARRKKENNSQSRHVIYNNAVTNEKLSRMLNENFFLAVKSLSKDVLGFVKEYV